MESPVTRRMRPLLGTFVEVAVRDESAIAILAVERAYESIECVHHTLSFHDPNSELSRINLNPGVFVSISRSTSHVLRLAIAMMRASRGAFDFTVGGELQLQGRLPRHDDREPLARGTVRDLELHDRRARILRPIRITVDGIAKGYAVDLAVRAMRRAGACAGWINAGGDLRAFGNIRVPLHVRSGDNHLTPVGLIENVAVATSHTDSSNRFPGHIVARDGEALETGVWTVMARHAWRADALTKVAALTVASDRERVVASLGGRWLAH
jgi:thiamine biosynthesis lipoprotein